LFVDNFFKALEGGENVVTPPALFDYYSTLIADYLLYSGYYTY